MNVTYTPARNLLLAAMSEDDFALVSPYLSRVPLPLQFEVHAPGSVIEWVYFPEDGIASVVSADVASKQCEVGLFGREGMSGTAAVLGTKLSPHRVCMEVAGVGLRLATAELHKAMGVSGTLTATVLRYVQAVMVQSASSTLAAGVYVIEQRLARLLLMYVDRSADNEVRVTHEVLSLMLGTRRAGITQALRGLEIKGLITRVPRCTTVADRVGLERLAGACYGFAEAEYARLLGQILRRGDNRPLRNGAALGLLPA